MSLRKKVCAHSIIVAIAGVIIAQLSLSRHHIVLGKANQLLSLQVLLLKNLAIRELRQGT